MKTPRAIITVLVLTVLTSALAQQAVAPPPKPAVKGPSLAETMQLIQNELNAVGRLSFVVHIYDKEEGNGISKYIEERSKVVADPATCTIRYHWWRSMHGDVVNDEDVSFSLRDVLGIALMNGQQAENKQNEDEQIPPEERKNYHLEFVPQVYLVVMRKPEDNKEWFSFTDKKQAASVAQAMGHVIELCGGKNVPL